MKPAEQPSSRPNIPRFHVLTDELWNPLVGHVGMARAALEGGAEAVQYRDKSPRRMVDKLTLAHEIQDLCRRAGRTQIVNDDVALAAAVGAGVHLGPNDLPPDVARRLLGPDALIGATANDLSRAVALARMPIDYLGVGPVYATASKNNPPPTLGLDALRAIVCAVSVPVIAIGGIDVDRVADVMATGVYGIAVLGGVCAADEPAVAAQRYRAAVDAAVAARCANA